MSSIWKKLQRADSITPALRDEIIREYGVRGKKALDAVIAKIEKNNLEKEGEKAIEEFNEQEPK